MGLKSHRSVEQDVKVTLPNAISVARGVGGVILGGLLATGNIDPTPALVAASVLAVSDMEGSLITITNNHKRLQKALRIIPSSFGRVLDPVMDKVFALPVIVGGTIGGQVPLWQAVSIGATELATASATGYAKARGGDPEASKIGKIGMVARCAVVGLDLAASAAGDPSWANKLSTAADALTPLAVGLGAVSCGQIIYADHKRRQQPLPAPEIA